MTNQDAQANTNKYKATDAEYMKALYASPRSEQECLRLAKELVQISRGTALEARDNYRVARHQRKV